MKRFIILAVLLIVSASAFVHAQDAAQRPLVPWGKCSPTSSATSRSSTRKRSD